MGMLSDWPRKFETATPGGINPSSSPQQFLGQILNNIVGDKKSEDGDSVRESSSPIDFIAPEAAGAMSKIGSAVGSAAIEAAPRYLGNEIGSIGNLGSSAGTYSQSAKNVVDESIPFAQRIRDAAAKSGSKVIPTAEQALNDSEIAQYKNAPKDFFDKAKAKATAEGVGVSTQERTMMNQQAAATKALLRKRNEDQIADYNARGFQNIKNALGGN